MIFNKNKIKEIFKKEFLNFVINLNYGDFFTDIQLKEFLLEKEISLSLIKAQTIIRELEKEIGIIHKKRLKRIRNEGYLILEPRIQANLALKQGKEKVELALKTTSRRLDAVNVSNWTREQQNELLNRTTAIDSLLNIMKNSSITKKIMNRKEVDLLQQTAIQSRIIKT